jgi:hypothetical protein
MRLWNWIRDHRTQSLIALVALLVAILALLRDVTGYQVVDPAGGGEKATAEPARAAVRRGPAELRMIGGVPNRRCAS